MKCLLILILLTFAITSCKQDNVKRTENECNVQLPAEELAWLVTEIDAWEQSTSDLKKYFYVQQAEYYGQTIFFWNNCCPSCLSILIARKCDGTELKNVDFGWITNSKVIWKPANCECVF